MSNDTLSILNRIATETSLRYAIQLITTSSLVAERKKATEVTVEDVWKVYGLFIDENRSSRLMKDYQDEYLFNEVNDTTPQLTGGEGVPMKTSHLEFLSFCGDFCKI